MFSNYFFLKRLAPVLEKKINGLDLLECYSQNKNELILGFGNSSREFYIRANLDPNVSLLSFPDSLSRASKNSVDLFSSILDEKVESISIFDYERSFEIHFETNKSLIFKMHGRRANILLTHESQVVELFRKSLTNDLSIEPKSLNKSINITPRNFLKCDSNPTTLIPALGREIQDYWNEKHISESDSQKWESFQKLLNELESNPIYLSDESSPKISLLPVDRSIESNDALEAANWLYEKTTRSYYFEKEKNKLISKRKQQITQSENYIFKTSEKLRLVQSQRSPDEVANIIMANLNLISKGNNKVVLNDFYSNTMVEIKLNPKLTPQKNAENYYRKAKNRHQEIESLEANIDQKKKLITSLQKEINEIELIEDSKALKRFNKSNKGADSNKKQHTSYLEFEIDQWKVLVGKNAKANDELTLKVATKNDLWLHAKDVSGSHVVVKQKPGQNYPSQLIEQAASLAAFYSKRKTETLCPVIYTQKKYVRKVKGAPAGQVIVEREEVVIVEPKDFKQL